jgi:hypothetical protein
MDSATAFLYGPFFLETPPPRGLTLSSFYPQHEKCWLLRKTWIALHGWCFSFTVKSNRWYGQASNIGTCLQVVERTWVQLYTPTLSVTLGMLCFLHPKNSIHSVYKMFLMGLENTFLLCCVDELKKHWWFIHRMRSPQLDENLHASINQTGLFYWQNFALKAKLKITFLKMKWILEV